MGRIRRYAAVVPVKTTTSSGHVVVTEAGQAMAGAGGSETKAVT